MKNDVNVKVGGSGPGFLGLLAIVFIVLKLIGVIDWEWQWVLAPIWIQLILVLIALLVLLIVSIFYKRKYPWL